MELKIFYKLAEAISLSLTSLTLQMCGEVIAIWWRDALAFIRRNRKPVAWISFGAVVHFSGSFLDNAYWGQAWDLRLKENLEWRWWFQNGVVVNIPFRQLATTIAAYCYVRGTFIYIGKPPKWLHFRMMISLAIGAIYVVATTPNLFN